MLERASGSIRKPDLICVRRRLRRRRLRNLFQAFPNILAFRLVAVFV